MTQAIVTSRDTLGMLGARLLDLSILAPDAAVTLIGHALCLCLRHDHAERTVAAFALLDLNLGVSPHMGRVIAYGQTTPGYSSTWAFSGTHWVELHPPTTPDRAPGVLTPSPDGQHLLLINTRGKTWTWTGQYWQYHPTHGNPFPSRSPRNNTALSAATDPALSQIVLLTTGPDDNDETWTMHDDNWTRHPRTP
jgi:hypothetical protein